MQLILISKLWSKVIRKAYVIKYFLIILKDFLVQFTKDYYFLKELLLSQNEKDLAVQAMHELGNIYHFSKDIK